MLEQRSTGSVSILTAWECMVGDAAASSDTGTVNEPEMSFYPMWRSEYSKVGHTEGRLHVREISISGTRAVPRPQNSVERQLEFFRKLAGFLASAEEKNTEDQQDLAKAVNDAIRFVVNWPRDLPLPTAGASDCGEVGFHWSIKDRNAILRFEGDGAYGYALMRQGRYVSGDVEVEKSSEIPKDLKEYLSLGHTDRALPK